MNWLTVIGWGLVVLVALAIIAAGIAAYNGAGVFAGVGAWRRQRRAHRVAQAATAGATTPAATPAAPAAPARPRMNLWKLAGVVVVSLAAIAGFTYLLWSIWDASWKGGSSTPAELSSTPGGCSPKWKKITLEAEKPFVITVPPGCRVDANPHDVEKVFSNWAMDEGSLILTLEATEKVVVDYRVYECTSKMPCESKSPIRPQPAEEEPVEESVPATPEGIPPDPPQGE